MITFRLIGGSGQKYYIGFLKMLYLESTFSTHRWDCLTLKNN